MKKKLWFCLIAIIVLLAVVYGPILTIDSINVLFNTEIPINYKTWFAISWLYLVLQGAVKKN